MGVFGRGHTGLFSDFLQVLSAESVAYVLPTGTRIPFVRVADGTYVNRTVPGFQGARITVNADGTRTLRMRDGATRDFLPLSFDGSLFQVQGWADRAGNRVQVERDGEERVGALIDAAGRRVTFTYSGRS